MTSWKLYVPVLLFLVLAAVLYRGLGRDSQEIASPLIGRSVPAFSLPDLDNPQRLHTDSELRDGPLLLNVWATWCVSCRMEHPFLMQVARDYGVPIIGMDYKDEREDARHWLQERGNPYRFTLSDAEGRLGLDLGVYGAPETYLVDRKGVIRAKHVGVIDEQVWQQELWPLVQSLRGEAP